MNGSQNNILRSMKRLIVVCAVAISAVLCSCSKSLNPRPEPHADVEFSLAIKETRQSHVFVWEVGDEGVRCEEQTLCELWVTDWNSCEVTAFSDNPAFDGVNFSSSAPDIIGVEKIDGRTCALRRKGDAPDGVVISAEAGTHRVSFRVYAKDVVPLKSIHLKYGGQDYYVEKDDTQRYPYMLYADQKNCRKYDLGRKMFGYADVNGVRFFDENMQEITKNSETTSLELLELVPENASFRYVVNWYSCNTDKIYAWDNAYCIIPEEIDPWPGGAEEKSPGFTGLDWSEIQGRRTEVLLPGLFCSFAFLVNRSAPDVGKNLDGYEIGETATYRFWGIYDTEGLRELPEHI